VIMCQWLACSSWLWGSSASCSKVRELILCLYGLCLRILCNRAYNSVSNDLIDIFRRKKLDIPLTTVSLTCWVIGWLATVLYAAEASRESC
jgi:hypothetical protein